MMGYMKEAVFIKQNADKWKKIEVLIATNQQETPDKIAELYMQLLDDLSFARTFYANSKVQNYLNGLSIKIHEQIYSKKKTSVKTIFYFWSHEFPLLVYKCRMQMLLSLLIFIVAVAVGALSAANDSEFVRLILGDSYVKMTEENVRSGDPMSVYKQMNGGTMFLGITANNIKVSFMTFVAGILLGLGTGYFLLYNGIMLGSFEYFFFTKNLFTKSLLTVSIHGVIEITSIIIAGGAGLVLGKSLLSPGTFSRLQAFFGAAKDGARVLIGLVPLFITAGLLESFVTRLDTVMPLWLNLLIIFGSIAFLISYFIFWPFYLYKKGHS